MPTKISSKKLKFANHENSLDDWANGFEFRTGDIPKSVTKPKRLAGIQRLSKSDSQSPLLWLISAQQIESSTAELVTLWFQSSNDLVAQRHSAKSAKSNKKKAAKAAKTVPKIVFEQTRVLDSINAAADAIRENESTDHRLTSIPLVAMAAAHSICAMAKSIDSFGMWWPIVDRLLELTDRENLSSSTDDLWSRQLLLVELPLTLAYQLPEIEPASQLLKPALREFATIVDSSLDYDGWPRAQYLPHFGPLIASWARCARIAESRGINLGEDVEAQLEWAVRQVLRLLRPDGSLMFGAECCSISQSCLQSILQLSNDRLDKKLAAVCLKPEKSSLTRKVAKKRTATLAANLADLATKSPVSSYSEWGESGILQSRWKHGDPKVGFDFSNKSFVIEIAAGKSLIAGTAMPNIRVNDRPAAPETCFEIVCEQFDEELDYVELEMQLAHSITLTRQIILSRTESFLMIADCVVPAGAGKIDYQCEWPLAEGVSAMAESETRELYLTTPKIQALVLPLALPEWKFELSNGRLEIMTVDDEDGIAPKHETGSVTESKPRETESTPRTSIRLAHSLHPSPSNRGAGLYTPLLIDLDPKRSKKKRTWRRLTVAEDRKMVPHDQGAAFRVQIDKQQWFFYRAVASKGIRSFLGENMLGEFVFNRFDREGKVTELLAIE